MARNGKIARLPEAIREEVNQRLADSQSAAVILAWLNARPEVQAVLSQCFSGHPVSPSNLAQWRQGGHREWLDSRTELTLLRQCASDPLRILPEDVSRLSQGVVVLYLARLFKNLRDRLSDDDLAAIQKSSHAVASLRVADAVVGRLHLDNRRLAAERHAEADARKPARLRRHRHGLSEEALAEIEELAAIL